MVAASMQPLLVKENGTIRMLSAGLTVFRVGNDDKLTFVPPGVEVSITGLDPLLQ